MESLAPIANVAGMTVSNSEDEGAWAVEPVDNEDDWFVAAIAESKRLSHERDSFDKVAEHVKNPLIDCTKMEWCNHAIDERTDEMITRPPGNHRGGKDDRVTETRKESRTETNWPSKAPELPKIECTTCDTNVLVPRFEGEKDDRCETRDLPEVPILGTAAPDPYSVTKNFDLTHARNLF